MPRFKIGQKVICKRVSWNLSGVSHYNVPVENGVYTVSGYSDGDERFISLKEIFNSDDTDIFWDSKEFVPVEKLISSKLIGLADIPSELIPGAN